jgi:hypothetical protein
MPNRWRYVLPAGPRLRLPLIRPEELLVRARAMTDDQLLAERVEWLPPAPRCAECRHQGPLVTITDRRHVRRVRRACGRQPLGHTDSNWTACPAFEAR